MGISLKNKLSNPIVLSVLLVLIGMIGYWGVLNTALFRVMQQKVYLHSEDFARTLAEMTDYLEETKVERDSRYDANYERISDITYCIQSNNGAYINEMNSIEGTKIQTAGMFFQELAKLKKNSDFYMHASIKGGRIRELEYPSDTGSRAYIYRGQMEQLIQKKSDQGRNYEDIEMYFILPKGTKLEHGYLGSEVVKFEDETRTWIFMSIQLSTWIIFVAIMIGLGIWYKDQIIGLQKISRLYFEVKLLFWGGIIFMGSRWLLPFCRSESVRQSQIPNSIYFAIVYAIFEGLIFCALGYGMIDVIKTCKMGIKDQIKNSLFCKHHIGKRLYYAIGIDIRKQGVTEIALVSIVHTFLLICVAFLSKVSIQYGMLGVLAMIFLMGILGEGILQDWKKVMDATYRISPSAEIEKKLDSIGIYRVYLGSCLIIYGMVNCIIVFAADQELASGIVCAGVEGCLGFTLLAKNIEILRKIYQYVDGILESKKQKVPDIGLLSPIVEVLEQVETGFNEAVQKEVLSQRMKTELISNVSHDLKTPLTSIISYVDLLKNGELSKEQQQKYIEILDRKSQRLKVLIEDLVEASKAASGNIELVKEEIDLVALLKQTLGEMNEKIENSTLKFKVNTPKEALIGRLDGKRTYRIFANLIGNIIKYAAPHSRVYIECFNEEEEGVVVFKNMSAYEMHFTAEEIVERFKRGDDSRHTDGSGLGLAIAKNLTELQGGKFEIYIDGDLFKVTLRFKIVSSQESNIEDCNNI